MLKTIQPDGVAFTLNDVPLIARAAGTLWMPERRALVVSDLHLGKAERNARRGGGLWPPYENDATLTRLETEIRALDPIQIVMLGDSFDDARCADALCDTELARITALSENCALIWITGNHDPAPSGQPGSVLDEMSIDGLTLRHIAKPGSTGEISGHYHPKAILHMRGRRISRKCFLFDNQRVILPAFGAYTGGLDVLNTAFDPLFDNRARAILSGETAHVMAVSKLRSMSTNR